MRKRALLIGINDYPFIGNLKYAEQDAEAFSESLQRNYGFVQDEIVLMKPGLDMAHTPTQLVMERQLRLLRDSRMEIDLLLVGFWGHGFTGTDGKRYLCATDTDDEALIKTGISFDILLSMISQIGAGDTCLILDCCQNAAGRALSSNFTESTEEELVRGAMAMSRDIQAVRQKKGFDQRQPSLAILNSCSVGERAYEWDERRHGIFTAHLLDAMNCQCRTVSDWMAYLGHHVSESALRMARHQNPYFKLEGGGVIFFPVSGTAGKGPEVVISEDPNQVQVRDYQVGEIQIKFEKITGSQEVAPRSEKVVLPVIPSEIRELQGELAGIEKLQEEVAAETATVLRPAKESIESARQQRDQIAKRQSDFWAKINPSKEERRHLETVINDQMDTTVSPLSLCSGKPDSISMPNFVQLVLWQQKKMQSEAIVLKTEEEYKEKRAELIEKLDQQKKDKIALQQTATTTFYAQVIDLILSVCPGYDKAESPVPNEELVPLLPLLDQYCLGRSDVEIWEMAENHWLENRPCLIQEKERLAREKAERERQRLEQIRKSGQGNKAGERLVETISGVEYAFRWCPPGKFMMGSPADEQGRYEDESQHDVNLTRGFWLLEHEVTQEIWESVMGANPSYFKGDNLPVEQVSWDDCHNFIDELNKSFNSLSLRFRLPTEAEWEYACRAGTRTPYSFGQRLNGDKANCNGNFPYGTETEGPYLEKTTPVKSYDSNAWGLYDMHGNVWEWCEDRYGAYSSGSDTDPHGSESGSDRVNRGGSWGSDAGLCRSANRVRRGPVSRFSFLGFRLALSSTD